ncbi:uncharacterized protein LOC129229825 [Uloborus diversus]|uniref:uncharacterized protein LOC129229825 n=1 Tax=Uloborus diversus TaxID=327109 RepID=UPI0024091AD9|nr:uncharacterized protein LOC129229825 [Uloborus diversus]
MIKEEGLFNVLFQRHTEVMGSKVSEQYEKVFKSKKIPIKTKISEPLQVVHSVKLYEVPQNVQERKIMQKKLKEIQLKRKELLEKSKQMGMDKVMEYLKQREEMTDKKLNLNKRKWKRRKLLKSNKMEQEERFWWLNDKKRTCIKNFLVEQVIDSWNSCNLSREVDGVQEIENEVDSQHESKQSSTSQISKQKSTDFSSDFNVFLQVPSDYDEQKFFSMKEEKKNGSSEKGPVSRKEPKPAPSDKSILESKGKSVKFQRMKETDAKSSLQEEERKEYVVAEEIAEDNNILADIVPQRSSASLGASEIFKTAFDEIPEYLEQNGIEELKTNVLERKALKKIDFLQTKWNDRDMGVIARNSVFKYASDLKDLHEYCYSEHTLLQSDYCRETIGDIVTAAIEAINEQKPSDPVAYLACFCLKNKHKFSGN